MTRAVLALLCSACAGVGIGQTVRDVYIGAGAPMIRSTRTMTIDWRTDSVAANEHRGFVLYGLTQSFGQLYASTYTPVLDPLVEDAAIPYNFSDRSYTAITAFDGGAVICWQRLSGELACVSVGEDGAIIGGPVDVARPPWSERTPKIAADTYGASIGYTGGTTDGCSHCNVFLRNLSSDLTHVSAAITVAPAAPMSSFDLKSVIRTATGRVGLLYMRAQQSSQTLRLRWVAADGALEPEITLPISNVAGAIAALQDNGELLLVGYSNSNTTFVQRFSTDGVPLGPAHVLTDPWVYTVDISPDGWILAADENYVTGELRFRLFNADGVPAGPWFDPTFVHPELPRNSFDGSFAPVAVTRGGAVWIAWISLPDEPEPAEWHLTTLVPFTRGDLNGDGRLDNFDIDAFVLALTDRAAFSLQYPTVDANIVADFDDDQQLTNFDIDPFVNALIGVP